MTTALLFVALIAACVPVGPRLYNALQRRPERSPERTEHTSWGSE